LVCVVYQERGEKFQDAAELFRELHKFGKAAEQYRR